MVEHSASQLSELTGTSNFSDLPNGSSVNDVILNSSSLSKTRQSTITAASSITELTHNEPTITNNSSTNIRCPKGSTNEAKLDFQK